ncbi:MAG TPA: hypothetical protein VEF89_14150 [Solirubrobacteraceae bacterium]|nr:hypothetical protein [Solirubrobacteraceae bacterium]
MSPVTRHAIVIERRFHGPPQSGHGGYTCGLLARELHGAVQVSLCSPPPLERPRTTERDDNERLLLRRRDDPRRRPSDHAGTRSPTARRTSRRAGRKLAMPRLRASSLPDMLRMRSKPR